MALRDTRPFREWVERSSPTAEARLIVQAYIFELHEEPWAAPSVPIPELSNHPEDEMRSATLRVGNEEVTVFYWLFYGSGDVDLIAIVD